MANTCNSNNAQWITLLLNSIVTFLFVFLIFQEKKEVKKRKLYFQKKEVKNKKDYNNNNMIIIFPKLADYNLADQC